ncbi:hypothetical protein [Roseomonas indoligenes]|uniref:SH3 domain-containing protein n=1 Tax=Roseomonas indoligenes TaxID=2820811 RepID=A0A940S5L9_9PROT|nr:hypothetical protein [Pararoseomonas indoligenes]MBP0494561.1 hypothetical protein [Pararoseomonas indoligenes]
MRGIGPLLLLPFLAGPALAAGPPDSGLYGGLSLAINGNQVSGVFSEARRGGGTEAAPQFSCVFLLRGRLEKGRGQVETWYPGEDPIPGNLSFEGAQASLVLRENHGGCLMTTGDMVGQPYRAGLDRAGDGWIGVALVTARRAAFRPAPGAPAPRTPYVVEDDPVAVLERRGEWVRARYVAGERAVEGWLRAAELAPDRPPGRR